MILRTLALALTTALAYTLLRGWPDFLPPFMRACLAVIVLVAGIGIWANRPPGDDIAARPRRTARWLDYAAIATTVLAVECSFLWLLGSAPQAMETLAIRLETRIRPEAAARRAVENGNAGSRPGNWLWTRGERRPLPKRTRFKPGMKPEVFIRPQNPDDAKTLLEGRVYISSFTLGRYDHATWSTVSHIPLPLKPDENGSITLTTSRPGNAIRHEIFHAFDPSGQNPLTTLLGATSAEIGPLQRIDDGFHLLPPANTTGGYQYHATSTPIRLDDLPDGSLLAPRRAAPGELLEITTNSSFRTRLQALARTAAGEGSIKQQLVSLRDFLRTDIDYSLVTTNPDDIDPIENFLFHEKRGHCEFFATSAALMARSLGLPSRIAYGWAGGTWYESSGLFVFRANEAHAWTEIWLETYGWVAMDPTPQAQGGSERARVAPAGGSLSEDLADEDKMSESAEDKNTASLTPMALGLAAAFAIPACLLGLLRSRRYSGDTTASGPPGSSQPPPRYWQAWRSACTAHGHPMPPGATLRQQVHRLPAPPSFAGDLVSYHYTTRYEDAPQNRETEKHLKRQIEDWSKQASNDPAPKSH